jgi:hypothetical protein
MIKAGPSFIPVLLLDGNNISGTIADTGHAALMPVEPNGDAVDEKYASFEIRVGGG